MPQRFLFHVIMTLEGMPTFYPVVSVAKVNEPKDWSFKAQTCARSCCLRSSCGERREAQQRRRAKVGPLKGQSAQSFTVATERQRVEKLHTPSTVSVSRRSKPLRQTHPYLIITGDFLRDRAIKILTPDKRSENKTKYPGRTNGLRDHDTPST